MITKDICKTDGRCYYQKYYYGDCLKSTDLLKSCFLGYGKGYTAAGNETDL